MTSTNQGWTAVPTLPTAVADWIEEAIVAGRFPEGERIREVEVSAEIGVSRAPVREALRILAARGLVRHVPRVGAVSTGLSPETVREVYALRALIESMICRAAVDRLTPQDKDRLVALLAKILELSENEQWDEMFGVAWSYRETLYAASRNRTAIETVRQLRARLSTVPHGIRRDREHLALHNLIYRQLTEAVLAGNAEAAGALISAFMHLTCDRVIATYGTVATDQPAPQHVPA